MDLEIIIKVFKVEIKGYSSEMLKTFQKHGIWKSDGNK